MISVLTLTYKRHHLLEEAIMSFLSQDLKEDFEMVVINDNPEVDYVYDNTENVIIINHKERFPSISAKIEWGYKQCKHNFIYRLDDDDLLAPWAMRNVKQDIENNPGYDIYRSKGMHFFQDNIYMGEGGSINNGNVYARHYLDTIKWPDTSMGEDAEITYGRNGKMYESKLNHTMCYRWGMGTLHVSGMGHQPNETILAQADRVLDNTKGVIHLHPRFINDYYKHLPK